MLSAGARAEQWFAVASPGAPATGTQVEVDLESVRARASAGAAVIRVTYDVLQQHNAGFQFRSFVASALFDCQRRTIGLTSAAYYEQPAGKGPRIGGDSSGSGALIESIPAATRRALLRATCATTQTSAA